MSTALLADFFDSQAWLVTRNLLFFFLVVFWLAVGYWTYKDARRRIQDRWLVAMATVLGLVPPFVGAVIYMLFRPPEYLEEVRERELEMKALQALRPIRGTLPGVPLRDRDRLSRLPRLHDAATGVVLRVARRRSIRCGRSARSARRLSRAHSRLGRLSSRTPGTEAAERSKARRQRRAAE